MGGGGDLRSQTVQSLRSVPHTSPVKDCGCGELVNEQHTASMCPRGTRTTTTPFRTVRISIHSSYNFCRVNIRKRASFIEFLLKSCSCRSSKSRIGFDGSIHISLISGGGQLCTVFQSSFIQFVTIFRVIAHKSSELGFSNLLKNVKRKLV